MYITILQHDSQQYSMLFTNVFPAWTMFGKTILETFRNPSCQPINQINQHMQANTDIIQETNSKQGIVPYEIGGVRLRSGIKSLTFEPRVSRDTPLGSPWKLICFGDRGGSQP